jgi:hypothetical protein
MVVAAKRWDYRVVRKAVDGGHTYGIHEVGYDAKGAPDEISPTSVEAWDESVENLRTHMEWMMDAFSLPVLDYDTLLQGEASHQKKDEATGLA